MSKNEIILFIEKEISFDVKEMSIEQVLNSNLLKKDAINALFPQMPTIFC
jgi:hypothetical protein